MHIGSNIISARIYGDLATQGYASPDAWISNLHQVMARICGEKYTD